MMVQAPLEAMSKLYLGQILYIQHYLFTLFRRQSSIFSILLIIFEHHVECLQASVDGIKHFKLVAFVELKHCYERLCAGDWLCDVLAVVQLPVQDIKVHRLDAINWLALELNVREVSIDFLKSHYVDIVIVVMSD